MEHHDIASTELANIIVNLYNRSTSGKRAFSPKFIQFITTDFLKRNCKSILSDLYLFVCAQSAVKTLCFAFPQATKMNRRHLTSWRNCQMSAAFGCVIDQGNAPINNYMIKELKNNQKDTNE